MAKANTKTRTKKEMQTIVDKGFADWDKALDDLIDSAEKCFMPLLAKSLELSKSILATYKKAFAKAAE